MYPRGPASNRVNLLHSGVWGRNRWEAPNPGGPGFSSTLWWSTPIGGRTKGATDDLYLHPHGSRDDRGCLRGAHQMTEVLARPQTSRQSAYFAASPRPIQHSAAARPGDQLASSLRRLGHVLIERGAKAVSGAVDRLSGKLEDIAS